MSHTVVKTKQDSECDACPRTGILTTFESRGNMWLCEKCFKESGDAYLREREKAAGELVQAFQKNHETINLVADIHNAHTIPIGELKAAIDQNPSIPDDKKQYAFCKEMDAHVLKMRQVVFEKHKAYVDSNNELAAWLTNLQTEVGRLHSTLRAEFTAQHVDYNPGKAAKPTKEKTPKAASVPGRPKKSAAVLIQEAAVAASTHDVNFFAVKMMMIDKNITADEAAQILKSAKTAAN